MRAACVAAMAMVLVGCAWAQEKPEAELRQQAQSASGKECIFACLHVAHLSLDGAPPLLDAGKVPEGRAKLDDVVLMVRRAVDCSLNAHKDQKGAEIETRKLIRRAHEIQRAMDSQDQPYMDDIIAKLEKERDRLLHDLFPDAAVPEKKP